MRVILLKDVGGVGQRGDVKEVSDGHAMNLLIPRGLAAQATKEALQTHERKMAEAKAESLAREAALSKDIASLHQSRFEMTVRATEKGGLFKSVGTKEIVETIRTQKGTAIPQDALEIKHPIKKVGEHRVTIKAPGATAEIVLAIRKA